MLQRIATHDANRDQVPVSVIIPVHNAGPHLSQLLVSLERQFVPVSWEVVVVNNRSTDGSDKVALSFADRLKLTVVQADALNNPSYARNTGVKAARGSKLLFLDADDDIAEGYVDRMAAALDTHEIVTSSVDSTSLNPAWVQAAHGPHWQTDRIATLLDFLPAAGANIGIRRKLFEELGGFPEEFSGSEDVALCWNAHIAGWHIHMVHAAVYRYRYRTTLLHLYKQAVNWGRDNVLLYAIYRSRGMPRRRWRDAARDWTSGLRGLVLSRNRSQRATKVVQVGLCIGRLKGTLLYRVRYL